MGGGNTMLNASSFLCTWSGLKLTTVNGSLTFVRGVKTDQVSKFPWKWALNLTPIYSGAFMLWKVKVLVAHSCLTLFDTTDSPKDSSVHGIFQARILEWVTIPFSRESSWPRNQIQVSFTAGRSLTIWSSRETWYFFMLQWQILLDSEKVCRVKAMVFPVVMYGCESWTVKKVEPKELVLLNCGLGEDSWESLGLQGHPNSPFEGDQPWDFFGRNDAKAETPVLWPPHAKSWLIGKDSDAGRD